MAKPERKTETRTESRKAPPPRDADPPEAAVPSQDTKPNRRKPLILALAGLLLLCAAAGGAAWLGVLPSWVPLVGARRAPEKTQAKQEAPVFIDLPEMIANLNGEPGRSRYVKLHAKLEIEGESGREAVQRALPRLQDMFSTYLRETRPEELRGAAGTYRLRQELIARAALAVAPAHVADVLFTQMIIQ